MRAHDPNGKGMFSSKCLWKSFGLIFYAYILPFPLSVSKAIFIRRESLSEFDFLIFPLVDGKTNILQKFMFKDIYTVWKGQFMKAFAR